MMSKALGVCIHTVLPEFFPKKLSFFVEKM